MTANWLLLFLAAQLALLVLDLRESRRSSQENRDPTSFATIVFLLGVIAVYLFVQISGGRLVPAPAQIFDSIRQLASSWHGADANRPSFSSAQLACVGIAAFYVAGLWDYLVHRFFSHHRWFWLTHEYHHLPKQVTVWMPGIVARPFGFLPVAISTLGTAVTLYAALAALGLPPWDFQPLLPVGLFIVVVLTASHSAFLRQRPAVHRILRRLWLTTPQEHLLHHGIESQCNYGNFTTLWDRLLGTYEDPTDHDLDSVRLGLSYDQDFLGTLTLGRVQLSPTNRERFQLSQYCNIDEAIVGEQK